jgi:hypothetical protein
LVASVSYLHVFYIICLKQCIAWNTCYNFISPQYSFQVEFANNFPLNNTSLLEIHICSTCMSNASYCFSVWKWRIVFYYYLFDSKLNFSNLLHRFVEYFLYMAYGSPSLVSLDNVWDPKYSHRNIERCAGTNIQNILTCRLHVLYNKLKDNSPDICHSHSFPVIKT